MAARVEPASAVSLNERMSSSSLSGRRDSASASAAGATSCERLRFEGCSARTAAPARRKLRLDRLARLDRRCRLFVGERREGGRCGLGGRRRPRESPARVPASVRAPASVRVAVRARAGSGSRARAPVRARRLRFRLRSGPARLRGLCGCSAGTSTFGSVIGVVYIADLGGEHVGERVVVDRRIRLLRLVGVAARRREGGPSPTAGHVGLGGISRRYLVARWYVGHASDSRVARLVSGQDGP